MNNRVMRELKEEIGARSRIWEIYHENSKMGRADAFAPQEWVVEGMYRYCEALNYAYLPEIKLPEKKTPLKGSLEDAIMKRESTREFSDAPIALEEAASLLHYSYGVNRDNADNDYPRPFRNAPSGGALYPLDIFFYANKIEGLKQAVYHYNPTTNSLRQVIQGKQDKNIASILVQQELVDAPMIVFITAQFERNLFKYKERGYRFVLLDAGHVAQNINLIAASMELGSVNIGGYFDRAADEFLDMDGLTQSTIYMIAVGHKA